MAVRCSNLGKEFGPQVVLGCVNFEVAPGEFVAITGPSGCGKSTLLNVVSGLASPTQGKVFLDTEDLFALSLPQRDALRLSSLGFVFQFFHLLPTLTVLENVCLPAFEKWSHKDKRKEAARRAAEVLDRVGLSGHTSKFPSELSGGMQSRVGFARAVVLQPRLLLADEPTGSLDQANGQLLLDLLQEHQAASGCTVIMVTHDAGAARRAHRRVRMMDGNIVET
jgi:putative ABC transport system ATP-binding protein